MGSYIPDAEAAAESLRQMSPAERDMLVYQVDQGRAVEPHHAALAVAVARRRLRRAMWQLPAYVLGCAVFSAVLGSLVTRSSAGVAFGFVLSMAVFVGWEWWGHVWRPRRRAEAANLALLDTGQAPDPPAESHGEWGMAVTLAWVATMAAGGVLHLVLGAPQWIGVPLFGVFILLFRRLVGRAVSSIDEWGKRTV